MSSGFTTHTNPNWTLKYTAEDVLKAAKESRTMLLSVRLVKKG